MCRLEKAYEVPVEGLRAEIFFCGVLLVFGVYVWNSQDGKVSPT